MMGRLRLLVFVLLLVLLGSAGGFGGLTVSRAAPDPAPCVGIASDSNGYGHVTFQLGPDGDVGIIYVRPLWVVLQDELRRVGLQNLRVVDRSLSASGLTSFDPTNYLKSIPYGNLTNDRCKYNVVGPFLPDVAAGKAAPDQYTGQMLRLVNGLLEKNPNGIIFVMNFYRTSRAKFTEHNSGVGLTQDRIDAFNAQLANICRPDGPIGRYPQVVCLNTQDFFDGMTVPWVLAETNQADFQTLFYRNTAFRARVDQFFQNTPDGILIGDGIHLSLAGRIRFMRAIANLISRQVVL